MALLCLTNATESSRDLRVTKKKEMIGAMARSVVPGGFTTTRRSYRPLVSKADDIKQAANAFLEKRNIVPTGSEHHFGCGWKKR